jgi:hypothetical protein
MTAALKDEAPGVTAEGFDADEINNDTDFPSTPLADQALDVIEGQDYAAAYLARLRAGRTRTGELGLVLGFLTGAMFDGACRVIEKELEAHHG